MAVAPPPPAPEPAPPPEPPKPSMLDMEKSLAATVVGALNAHDPKKYAESFATDGVSMMPGMPELKGRDEIAAGAQKLFDAFPDFKVATVRSFAKGDVVFHEWVMNATNKGEFMGMKASNKPVGMRGITVVAITPDGLAKSEHRYFDMGTTMAQVTGKGPARPIPAMPTGDSEWHVAKGTPEEDKAADLLKGMYGAFEKKSEADFLGPMDDKVTWSDLSQPKDMSGKAEGKKFFATFTKAFADVKMSGDPIIAVDDFIVAEGTMNATHAGQLGPLKPTRKPVTLHAVDVVQVKDGKIVMGTTYANSMEIMAQEGLLPKPKPAKAEGDKKPAGDKGDKKPSADAAKKGDTKPASDKK
jgi:steroid delta-isomerase-like uncharacterized protein